MAGSSGVRALWRNSACLILGSSPIQYLSTPLVSAKSNIQCYIKERGEADVTSPQVKEPEYLFVKRSANTGFWADVHVFPGGVVDEADYSSSWKDLFTAGVMKNVFHNIRSKSNLPIYETASSNAVPGEVATRISAIRETFEETGVLLLRHTEQLPSVADCTPGTVSPAIKVLPVDQSDHWRRLVHNDAKNFIAMCRDLECVPDIFSLIEWSDWLTPSNYPRRFDTVFYLCCTDSKPTTAQDNLEVSEVKWLGLSEGVRLMKERQLMFAPPQYGLIRQLQGLQSLSCIHSYGLLKAKLGEVSRRVSVRIRCQDSDGPVSVTQLDDLFPVEANEYKPTAVSFHHCQSPSLSDIVKLRVNLTSPIFEYDCLSHTAEQLEELSTNISRLCIKADDLQSIDNVISKHIEEHKTVHDQIMRMSHHSKL